MNADSLLMRLKSGERLAEREIDSVRRAHADDRAAEDKYTLVHVLWKSGDVQSRDLIKAQLVDADEMVAAATALGTLGAMLPARSAEAARLLIQFFDQRLEELGPEWEAYYEGLLELMQVPQARRPLATRALRASDIDSAVIDSARRLAFR